MRSRRDPFVATRGAVVSMRGPAADGASAMVLAILPFFRADAGLGYASRMYQAAFTVIRSRVAGIR
jgi:ribosomal protein S18 acetylase RimI-like enzyme